MLVFSNTVAEDRFGKWLRGVMMSQESALLGMGMQISDIDPQLQEGDSYVVGWHD